MQPTTLQNTTDELQNANGSCKMQPNIIDTIIEDNSSIEKRKKYQKKKNYQI